MHARRLRGREDRLGVGIGLEAGDVLRDRAGEQLDVLRQIADMAAERLRRPIDRAPRRRAGPCRGAASRRRRAARASDDLPEALGPMMPRPLPALSEKVDILHDEALDAGRRSRSRPRPRRSRSAAAAAIGGFPRRAAPRAARSRRFQLWRAATKPRQLAIASSTGASAREVRIELAMMMPAVACCSITR